MVLEKAGMDLSINTNSPPLGLGCQTLESFWGSFSVSKVEQLCLVQSSDLCEKLDQLITC